MNNFYIYPLKPDEIYHFGVSKRNGAKVGSGRYPLGSGDRPYQDLKAEKKRKWENKMTKKLDRLDQKKSNAQSVANKKYQKAVNKENSFFSTKKGINKAYAKADNAQRVVNRLDYKENKYYNKYVKKFERNDITMSAALRKRGMQYYENVVNNSKATYMTRRIG